MREALTSGKSKSGENRSYRLTSTPKHHFPNIGSVFASSSVAGLKLMAVPPPGANFSGSVISRSRRDSISCEYYAGSTRL